MIFAARSKHALSTVAAFTALAILACQLAAGQQSPVNWTAEQDHQNMMNQLGIKALRPGPSGNEKAPNHANYDEEKANPTDLPDALTLKSGQKVTSPAQWWNQRRPEIMEDFEREVLGRIPLNAPKVTWTVKTTINSKTGVFPVIEKQLVGHVDNSACPSINVDIEMTLVTPGNTKPCARDDHVRQRAALRRFIARPSVNSEKMLRERSAFDRTAYRRGLGLRALDTSSIQADNGAGLTKGIIGLATKASLGSRRTGALCGRGHGALRAVSTICETDKAVDAKHVGIEGVSRYGKAALVTMAFDTRFAVVLVGSSGEGGAKPHRRNFGEAVENLTGSGEYHWMAGNFLKYGAAESSFGSKNAGDLPVDSHELIALCAPRLDLHQLRRCPRRATQMAGPAGQLYGDRRRGRCVPVAGRKRLGSERGLSHRENAAREHRAARWPARMAAA